MFKPGEGEREPWKECEGWGEKAKQENRRRLDTRWAKQKYKGKYKENPAENEKITRNVFFIKQIYTGNTLILKVVWG